MKITLILLIIAFLFTITEATTIALNNTNGSPLTIIDIDPSKLNFKFAVSWPPGFCKINTCQPGRLPDIFTIHGLWPNVAKSTEQYDFQKLKPIHEKLSKYWPNIESSVSPQNFYGDEWEKHGATCSLFTVKGYFDEALRLYGLVESGLKLLSDGKSKPQQTTAASIRKMKAFAGKKPFVVCKEVGLGAERKNYLTELRFCLNDKKEFMDCEPQATQDEYCSKPFRYSATLLWNSLLAAVGEEEDIII